MVRERSQSRLIASTSTTELESTTSSNIRRPTYKVGPIFEGVKGPLGPRAWIKQYEVHARWMGWSETEKVEALCMHLASTAQKWYSTTFLEEEEINDITWSRFKEAFLHRFDQVVEDPLTKWLDFVLDSNQDVASYFQEKTQLGNAARQDQRNQVTGLTRGMPMRYKSILVTAAIKTPSEWLALAQKLEHTFKGDKNSTQFKKDLYKGPNSSSVPRPTTMDNKPEIGKTTQVKTPFAPCQICARIGKPNQMHWHRDCPSKTMPRVQTGEVESIDQGNVEGSLASSDSEQQ